MIRWACPYCKEPMEAPESLAETVMKCPICATPCWAPAAPNEPPTDEPTRFSADHRAASTQRRTPLITVHGNRLWMQVASGVCVGLIGFVFFIAYVLPRLPSRSPSIRAPSSVAPPRLADWFELVDKGYRVTNRSQNYWYVAWRIDVENVSTSARIMGRIRIQLLDAEGFEIESDYQYNYRFEPGMNSLTGTTMVPAANGPRIARIEVFTSE